MSETSKRFNFPYEESKFGIRYPKLCSKYLPQISGHYAIWVVDNRFRRRLALPNMVTFHIWTSLHARMTNYVSLTPISRPLFSSALSLSLVVVLLLSCAVCAIGGCALCMGVLVDVGAIVCSDSPRRSLCSGCPGLNPCYTNLSN